MNKTHDGDNRNNSTFNFLLKLDSDTVVSHSITGDAGVCVVQVLWSHLFYDGSLCDLDHFKFHTLLSESGKEFQLPHILMKTPSCKPS